MTVDLQLDRFLLCGRFDDPDGLGSRGRSQRQTAALSSPNVAERPARRTGSRLLAASRQIRLRRCAPRSVPMNECSSSMTMKESAGKDLGKPMRVIHEERLDRLGCDQEHARGMLEQAALGAAATSPCHLWTGISASRQSSSRRENWSLMSALSGPT